MRGALRTLAAAVDYVAYRFRYPIPRLGRVTAPIALLALLVLSVPLLFAPPLLVAVAAAVVLVAVVVADAWKAQGRPAAHAAPRDRQS